MQANERSSPTPRRIVSRDFIAGACDGSAPELAPGSTAHDYARKFRGDQTLRERAALSRKARAPRPSYPLDQNEHMRRTLRTEYLGGMVIGYVFGFASCVVTLVLSSPWWAPLVAWMVQR